MAGREKLPPGMVPGSRPAEEHPAYRGDEVGYWAVHKRLRATRGPASDHVCACGAPAHDWAYLGEREPGDRFPFSTDLDLYEAMCRSCHVRHDRAVA